MARQFIAGLRKEIPMKLKLFASCVMVLLGLAHAANAAAEWRANIHVEGKNRGGQHQSDVTIGVASEAVSLPAPPLPPGFTCSMTIPSDDWTAFFTEDIRQEGEEEHIWVIAVNPHGNIGPPFDATSTMSWDPTQFGPGDFELREGWEGTGEILIPDMKTVTKFDVTGGNKDQYLTVICRQ